ncbi:MAG: sigma-70 family RNA polymerase sigma factor [Acidobacteriota bacterium]
MATAIGMTAIERQQPGRRCTSSAAAILESPTTATDTTRLLRAWSLGDETAGRELIPLVFKELRRLASGCLLHERRGHTLDPTALVNEAYLRLVGSPPERIKNRGHFFALAGRVMRRILVDHARHHRYQKRGGGARALSLTTLDDLAADRPPDLVALDQALNDLATFDPRKAEIVELRFFVGLDLQQIATTLGCSTATVTRHWLAAKAWLFQALTPEAA